jgi:uncharacterized protein
MNNPVSLQSVHSHPPLRRDTVLAIVKAHQQQLQQLGVQSLELFGSVARDEAHPESDVDFLVELSRPTGLIRFIQIRQYLEELLKCSVDLGTTKSLKEHLREPVLKDAIRVF